MQKFLYMQCGHSQINYPRWAQGWIDVRKLFSNWFGVRRCGILKMLDYLGLEFEGNQHCGEFFNLVLFYISKLKVDIK